jgi:hypothetical protein
MLRAAERRGMQQDPGRISFADACRSLTLSRAAGVSLLALLVNPAPRPRTSRPRKLMYRGKNYGVLKAKPAPQRRIA